MRMSSRAAQQRWPVRVPQGTPHKTDGEGAIPSGRQRAVAGASGGGNGGGEGGGKGGALAPASPVRHIFIYIALLFLTLDTPVALSVGGRAAAVPCCPLKGYRYHRVPLERCRSGGLTAWQRPPGVRTRVKAPRATGACLFRRATYATMYECYECVFLFGPPIAIRGVLSGFSLTRLHKSRWY